MLSIEEMEEVTTLFKPYMFELVGDRDGYKLQLPNGTEFIKDLLNQSKSNKGVANE